MTRVGVLLFTILLLASGLGGCLAPRGDEATPAATNATATPAHNATPAPRAAPLVAKAEDAIAPGEPSLSAATREFPLPEGASFLVIPVHLGEEDWFKDGSYSWWRVLVSTSKGVALSYARTYDAEGGELQPVGASLAYGSGSTTSLVGGERQPHPIDRVIVMNVVAKGNASTVRVGAADSFAGKLPEAIVAGRALAQGVGSLSYDLSSGLADDDLRAGVDASGPGVAKGAARLGAFHLTAAHDVAKPSLHSTFMWVWPSLGAGAWRATQTVAGKAQSITQPLAWGYLEGSFPMIEGDAIVQGPVKEDLDDAEASALPDFLLVSATVPWDPASAGYSMDASFHGGFLQAPVLLATPQGCVLLASEGARDAPSCAAFSS